MWNLIGDILIAASVAGSAYALRLVAWQLVHELHEHTYQVGKIAAATYDLARAVEQSPLEPALIIGRDISRSLTPFGRWVEKELEREDAAVARPAVDPGPKPSFDEIALMTPHPAPLAAGVNTRFPWQKDERPKGDKPLPGTADGMELCQACKGSGTIGERETCQLCKGEGEVPTSHFW